MCMMTILVVWDSPLRGRLPILGSSGDAHATVDPTMTDRVLDAAAKALHVGEVDDCLKIFR